MNRGKKIVDIVIVMVMYLILIFFQISPKILFKDRIAGIPKKERVYIYPEKNISIIKIDDKFTGLIKPDVVELAPGTHEVQIEYKKGKVKEKYFFEPYNYPAGTKVTITGTENKENNNTVEFDLKFGAPEKNEINLIEYIFYIISSFLTVLIVLFILKQIKTIDFYKRKIDNNQALIDTKKDLYISKINSRRVNVKSLKVPEGKYWLDIVYTNREKKFFFQNKVVLKFNDVEVELVKNDILRIGYLIEKGQMRLDFELKKIQEKVK